MTVDNSAKPCSTFTHWVTMNKKHVVKGQLIWEYPSWIKKWLFTTFVFMPMKALGLSFRCLFGFLLLSPKINKNAQLKPSSQLTHEEKCFKETLLQETTCYEWRKLWTCVYCRFPDYLQLFTGARTNGEFTQTEWWQHHTKWQVHLLWGDRLILYIKS